MYTNPDLSVRTTGISSGKTVSWDLVFTKEGRNNDSWCMLNKANKNIGQSGSVTVSWRHAVPAASVTGNITISGRTYSFVGAGQNDHVFGNFIPFVNLFQQWIDGHFNSVASGFNMYWGSMVGSWTFARVSMPGVGTYMFSTNNAETSISYTVKCDSTNHRPMNVTIIAAAPNVKLIVSYAPIVSNLAWSSSDNVEDIVSLVGSFNGYPVSARGWGQVIGRTPCS